jgi:glycine hydroxymethyltransferase
MQQTAAALAHALVAEGLPVFAAARGATTSHQFALEAMRWGGGQAAARRLARARLLACGIGLPLPAAAAAACAGDVSGLRLGVPEIVRLGMGPEHMAELGALVAQALRAEDAAPLAHEVSRFRQRFNGLRFVR